MHNIKSFDTAEELSAYKSSHFNTEYLILKDNSKSEGESLYIGKGDASLPPPRPGDILAPSTDDTDNAPERQNTSIELPEGETAPSEDAAEADGADDL